MENVPEPIVQENQSVTSEKVEKNAFTLALSEPAIESRVHKFLGINPNIWYTLKDKGILPQSGTYGEYVLKAFTHYREQNEIGLAKVALKQEELANKRNYRSSEQTESGLPKVVEAEKIQKIRLDAARERQIHLQNLQARNELISKTELFSMISPLIGNIVNVLRSAADDDPRLQPVIDKCFVSLHLTAEKLLQQVDSDNTNYVEEMMNKPVDLDELLDNADLELS
jgi:hypothetical protein